MAGNLYEQGYYETGTASITQGQTVVTGQGTAWSQIVRPADDFGKHVGMPIPIASVDSDTQITLAYPWPGPTQAAAPYRVTFTPYHVAYRQALQEIGQLLSSGNVSALAGLVGAANKVPMFTGPGALDLIAKEDLINGVRFDVQVPDIASRAAYDNEAAGFTVLVADVGDGRSAIYTKSSATAADWSDPAYLTGPKGDTGSPWDDWQGGWATATAYAELAGVENGGSSYICTSAHTSDATSEPGVGASWQTYWDLVAAKGADGAGTGDVVGPAGATNGHVAVFDGATGKLIEDGGNSLNDFLKLSGGTLTGILAFNSTLGSSNQLLDLQQGYGVYSDNAGSVGSSRLWINSPDNGEINLGPRTGGEFLALGRFNAELFQVRSSFGTLFQVDESDLLWKGQHVYRQDNIVGAVSVSGGGTPTGSIIEKGSNANGQYVKYADGTLICWRTWTTTTLAIDGAYGDLFIGALSWAYPSAFVGELPSVNCSYLKWGTSASWPALSALSLTSTSIRVYDIQSRPAGTGTAISVTAIGRWY